MVTFNRTKSLVKVVMTLMVVLAISACSDWFKVGLGDAVDVTAPRLTIESPSNEDVIYTNNDITFSGTVEDDIGVSKVVISYPGGTRNASISGNNWTVTVPFDTITQSGRVIFNIIGYDTASPPKETNTATREIIVDNTAPTVLVKAPSEYSPSPQHSGYVVIEGETYDNDSPIDTVVIEIYDDSNILVASKIADGDYSWSTRINFNDTFDGLPGFPPGSTSLEEYKLKVIVTDLAGNTNTYAYHASDFWAEWDRLASGTLFPAMKEIGLWDQGDATSLVTELKDKTTGDPIFPVDENFMHRHNFSEINSIDLIFTRNENKDIPILALSNLSTSAMGSIGEEVPILASATDDKEGIKQDSLVLYIYTDSGRTNLLETIAAANVNAPGDGLYCSFEFPLNIPTGVYYATMNAEDKKGTANSLNFYFLVDKGAPRITDITPASTYASLNAFNNTVITVMSEDDNKNVTLSYTVIDLDSGSEYSGVSHTPTVTNNEITSGGVTSYQNEYEITINDPVPENFELTIQIDDFKGLRTTQSKSYTLDKEAPVVFINNPISGDPVSGNALTTTGTASDATSAPSTVSVMLEQGATTSGWIAAKGNTEWSQAIDLSTFSEGDMILYAKAEDIAGNESAPISVSFSYDKAAPSLDFGTRQALSYETGTFSFAGTATDTNSVKTVEIYENKDDAGETLVETVTINAASGNWAFNKTVAADGSDDGEYLYRVVVTDVANKTKEDSRVIRIDTQKPVIEVNNLTNGASVETATFEIKGTATDYSGLQKNGAGKQFIEYDLNNTGSWTEVLVSGTGSWSIPVNGLAEGTGNNIQLRGTDRNGLNADVVSINFGLDLNPPTFVITDSATLNGSTVNSSFTISGTAQDANGIALIEYKTSKIDWTTMEVSPGTAYSSSDDSVINWSQDFTVNTDVMNNKIEFRIKDSYNRMTEDFVLITYDISPPIINIDLKDGTVVTLSNLVIKGETRDIYSDIASVEYSQNPNEPTPIWNPVQNVTGNFQTWDVEMSGLEEGLGKEIEFRAIDAVGNPSTTGVINFGLDLDDPSLTVTEIATYDGKWIPTDSLSLSGTTHDKSGISSLQVSIDNGLTWGDGTTYDNVASITLSGDDTVSATWSATVTGLVPGENKIKVRATDGFQKKTLIAIDTLVDLVAPEKPLFTTPAEQYFNNTLSIAGTAADGTGSGIAKVEYLFAQTLKVNSIDPANEQISITAHGYSNDDVIRFNADTLPTGISAGTDYYVISSTANTFQISETLAGAAFNFTDSGIAVQLTSTHGGSWNDLSGTVDWVRNIDISALSENLKETVYVRSTDRAGNISPVEGLMYHIDRANPTTTTNITNTLSFQNTDLTISGTADDGNGIKSVEVNYSDDLWQTSNAMTISGTLPDWNTNTLTADGTYDFEIIVTDNLNRTTTYNRKAGIDKSPAALTITSPVTNENVLSNDYTAGGTVSDGNGNGIQALEYRYSLDGGTNWVDTDGATPGIQDWTPVPTIAANWLIPSLDFTGTEGPRRIEVRADDGLNGIVTAGIDFYHDNTSPLLEETGINTNTQVYRNTGFNLEGSASDSISFKDVTVQATKNGIPVPFIISDSDPDPNLYNFAVGLPGNGDDDGRWVYTITATDNAGNETSLQRSVLIDETAPTALSITTPAGQYFSSTVNIVGTSGDGSGSGIEKIQYSFDGSTGWTNLTGTDNWAGNINITDASIPSGTNTLYVRAIDRAQNTSSIETLQYYKDVAAPTVAVTTAGPWGNTVYKDSFTVIAGTAGDDAGLANVTASATGSTTVGPRSGSLTSWSFPVTPQKGLNTITITATDNRGESTSETVSFFYDTDYPVLSAVSLANNSNISTSELTITGEASDSADESGIALVEYKLNTDPWTAANGKDFWNVKLTGLSDQMGQTIQFRVTDKANNITTGSVITFNVDTEVPEIKPEIYVDWDADFGTTADTEVAQTNQAYSVNVPQFAYKFLVRDTLGIASVSFNIPGVDSNTTTPEIDPFEASDTGNTEGPTGNQYDVWTTGPINISALSGSEGNHDWTVTVTDTSGQTTTSTRTILVDNTAPTIDHRSPNTSEILNGNVTIQGGAQDEANGSGLAKLEYFIGLDIPANTNTWQEITSNLYNWEIELKDATKIDTYATSDYATDVNGDGSVWALPIKLRVTDNAGNVSTETDTDYVVKVNPDADKPLVDLIYPDPSEANSILGGTIRIFGTATDDDDGIGSVQVQIDVNNDGFYTAADVDKDGIDWFNGGNGRAASGTAAWNITINRNDEFHPDFLPHVDDKISIRARAIDGKGTVGPWSTPKEIQIDANVPSLGPLSLVQGSSTKEYTAGMYIKGDWALEGYIADDGTVDTAEVKFTINGNPTTYNLSDMTAGVNVDGNGKDGYTYSLPIETTTVVAKAGAITIDIVATDNTNKTTQVSYILNYDNKNPVLSVGQLSGNRITSGPLTGALDIEQSNESFEIASSVDEADSGFERIAYYITREGGVTPRVFNLNGSKGQTIATTKEISSFTADYVPDVDGNPATGTNDPFYRDVFSSGTVAKSGDDYTFTSSDIDFTAPLVRKGGLIKIQGLYYTIADYNGTDTVTIKNATLAEGTSDAEIPYALIVDNFVTEGPVTRDGSGEITAIGNDDGDWLIEGVQREGITYNWTSSINSLAIPDGPIKIHWVAFDKAGNFSTDSMNGMVQNNRPRLAKMRLGTDLDANTIIEADANEKTADFDLGDTSATKDGVSSATVDASSVFTAKDKSLIELEIVGGNTALGNLAYELSDESANILTLTDFSENAVSGYHEIELSEANLITIGEDAQTLNVKVWDATEDTTKGTDSQFATLDVTIAVDVIDNKKPMAVIKPFEWNDADETDNNLYKYVAGDRNGDTIVDPGEGYYYRENGHIEITGVHDGNDPDVSGKISIRGSAYDNNRIDAIYVRIDGMTMTTGDRDGFTGSASYNTEDYVLIASNNNGSWTYSDKWSTEGWKASENLETLDQSGHRVNWQLDWDTSKITNTTAVNANIKVVVVDKNPNNSNFTASGSSADDTTYNVPVYTVDVVPYITAVTRHSDFNTIRSRQGWSVLRRGEEVAIKGFNIASPQTNTLTFGTAAVNITSTDYSSYTVIVPDTATSGDLSLVVNGIPAINNLTDNSKQYNIETEVGKPESALWIDDRKVHIWQSDDNQTNNNRGYFTGSIDPEYPAMTIDNSGILYGSWSNYASSDVIWGTNNTSATTIYSSYDPLEHTDIHFGSRQAIVYNANTYGNNNWDQGGAGGVQIWDTQSTVNPTDGSAVGNFYNMEELYHDEKLMQFINPRIVSEGNNIHISYYDTDTKSMKYSYQLSGSNSTTENQNWISIDGGFDIHDAEASVIQTSPNYNWNDNHAVVEIHVKEGDIISVGDPVITLNNGSDVIIYSENNGYVGEILVDPNSTDVDNTPLISVFAAADLRAPMGPLRSAAAGEFSAVDVVPSDPSNTSDPYYPVIAYYDITNKTVKLAYATSEAPVTADWTLQTVMLSSDPNKDYSGKYISMKVDSQGYIHLAFFRNSTGDLLYMKSTNRREDPSFTGYTFGNSVIIDSEGSVGIWADLTLDNDKPVISYIDSSLVNTFDGVKMAYYDPGFEQKSGDTADEPDTADGWEYMNAALNFEVESVRTSIEKDTGTNYWKHAIGYGSTDYFRIGYYVE